MHKRLALAAAALTLPLPGAAGAITISGTYFEDTVQTGCPETSECRVIFPVLPSSLTGTMLVLTEISCSVVSDQPIRSGVLRITDNLTNDRRPHFLNVSALAANTTFRDPMNIKVSGGPPRQLVVTFQTAAVSSLSIAQCTIVGTISAQ